MLSIVAVKKLGVNDHRTAGGLDFTAKDSKRQGHAVPQSLKTTR
jgi:hypothetical protein